MESNTGTQTEHRKLDFLHGAHDLPINSMEVKAAGGNMISQGAPIYINLNLQAKGKGRDVVVENLAAPSMPHTAVLAADRLGSIELGQVLRRILTSIFNTLRGRTGSEVPDPIILAPFGECDPSSKLTPAISKGEAYVTSMLLSGNGLACWQPRPQDPIQQGVGVMPGDVGNFNVQDGFQKFFNVWDDEDAIRRTAEAHAYKVSYSAPTRSRNITRKAYLEGDTVVQGTTSETTYGPDRRVTGFQFRHLNACPRGGVLAITSDAILEKLTPSTQRSLYEHILQHAELFYRHVAVQHDLFNNPGLYFVTECIKSESWALAGFTEPMVAPQDTLKLRPFPRVDASRIPEYRWTEKGTADGFCGVSEVAGSQDQCLFLKGYKLDFSQAFQEKIRDMAPSNAKYSDSDQDGSGTRDPEGGNEHDASGPGSAGMPERNNGRNFSTFASGGGGGAGDSEILLSAFPMGLGAGTTCHPCDAINMYLLKETGSDSALSHDDDWITAFEGSGKDDEHPVKTDEEGPTTKTPSVIQPSVQEAISKTRPYDLPVNFAPLASRSRRRMMLGAEISESLRAQLLWERQQTAVPVRRTRTGVGNIGLQGVWPSEGQQSDLLQEAQARSDCVIERGTERQGEVGE